MSRICQIENSGHTISVTMDGPLNGVPILFITGFIGSADFWRPVIDILPGNFLAISYDQRGSGLSANYSRPLTMKQLADDAIAVIEALKLEKLYVIGHSMGACTAWILASELGDQLLGTYLIAGWDKADLWMKWVFETRLAIFEHVGPLAYAKSTTLFMNPPEVVNANEGPFTTAAQALSGKLPALDELQDRTKAVLSFNASDWAPSSTIPMRITCAEDDWMTPIELSRGLVRLFESADTKWFTTGGHYFPRTQAPELVGDILSWTSTIRRTQV